MTAPDTVRVNYVQKILSQQTEVMTNIENCNVMQTENVWSCWYLDVSGHIDANI